MMAGTMIVREIIKSEREIPDLHQKIRDARLAAKFTVQYCSSAAGVSRQYWAMIESNRAEAISIELLRKIETLLGASFL